VNIRLPKSKNILRMILGTTRAALATAFILFLFSLGVNRGLPFDRSTGRGESPADVRRWAAMVFQSVGYRPYAIWTEATLLNASSCRTGMDGRDGGENIGRASESNEFGGFREGTGLF